MADQFPEETIEGEEESLEDHDKVPIQVRPLPPQEALKSRPVDGGVENSKLNRFYRDRFNSTNVFPDQFIRGSGAEKGIEAEKQVYNLLSSITDEPMVVYHSRKFCVKKVCEIDFLILHKDRGVILLEVKSAKKEKDFNNAEQQLGNAQGVVKEKLKRSKVKKIPVRYAVVMPNVSSLPNKSGCFQGELESKETFVEWLKGEFPPEFENYNEEKKRSLFDECLLVFHQNVTEYETSIDRVTNELIDLTSQQHRLVNGISPEQYIYGPAGSGKTEILIYKVCSKELKNLRKLVVCVNKPLQIYLRARLAGIENVMIKTFSGLLCYINCISFDDLKKMGELHQVKKATKMAKRLAKYECIFVDEAQDLKGLWEALFDELHEKHNENAYKWFFLDNNQVLNHTSPPKRVDKSNRYTLRYVIRNTENVFKESLSYFKSDKEPELWDNSIVGPDVVWDYSFSHADITEVSSKLIRTIAVHVKQIWKELDECAPGDLCILVDDIKQRDKFCEALKSQGVCPMKCFNAEAMLEHKYTEEEGWQIGKDICGVTVDSVRRYKGLESKAVLIVLNAFNSFYKSLMYSAVTRCHCKLIILSADNTQTECPMDVD